jgi:EAL domain-containing protein (putative c-di-GMP-specific phosphodiesterase class I)
MSDRPPLDIDERAQDRAAAARYLRQEMDGGLDSGQFRLVYQPKLAARRGAIDSCEALVRWDHPDRGLVLPDNFIIASEMSGGIGRLTRWTMEQAMADQRAMRASGAAPTVFVNLSAQLLTVEETVASICELAKRPGADLGIEVTERSVIDDPGCAFANIRRLREAGIKIAIDDYGAGLSSLTYLKQIEADELKIDKSFIISLGTSHRDPLIVRSTIDLAHALGMQVTAEGVETPAAHALLTVMGCDMMQGYLIGRPMRPELFINFLSEFDAQKLVTPNNSSVLHDHKFWKRA